MTLVFHIARNTERQWSVRRHKATRASRVYKTKREALLYAVARGDVIYLHHHDGRVQSILTVNS